MIFAWRARFIISVSESIISLALLVAASIAVMRAACSAATDSSSARKIWMPIYFGKIPWKQLLGRLLVDVIDLGTPRSWRRPHRRRWYRPDANRRPPTSPLPVVFLRSSSEASSAMSDVDFADLLDRQQALGDEALRDDRLEFVEEK